MKREIKFRAWDGNYNEMMTRDNMPDLSFWKYVAYDSNTPIMQFTGLTDKNGKEIYEGDIISNELIKGIVVFDSGCFCIKVVCIINKDAGHDAGSCPALFDFIYNEIIGNIYENPELL
jgi:uncharacterized phage protein (TIGR01671 family)